VSGCTLIGNAARGGNGGDGQITFSEGLGGGLLNAFGATLTVSGSNVSCNRALGGDHSTPTAANPLTGAGQGGGIGNILATLSVSDCAFDGNLARGGAPTLGRAAAAWAAASTDFPSRH
jgi:hypothetical protein